MREIRFRAWDKERKEMLPVELMDFSQWWVSCDPHYGTSKPFEYGERNSFKNERTDRHIIMQYTGLTDRNGKEIYEGDIVKNHGYSELCIVNYHESQYIGRYKPQTLQCDLENEKDMHYIGLGFYVRDRNSIEVIGNIYENPELIEVSS